MKKLFGLFLCIMMMFLLATASALAAPIYYDNNWYSTQGPKYLGDADPFIATIDGNDNPNQDLGDLNQVIDDWNAYFDGAPGPLDDDFPLPYLATATTDLAIAGNPISTPINVAGYKYLTVKYAGYVDIFNVEGLNTLDWEAMIVLNPQGKPIQNGISHYRLWNPTPSAVPVPAPILLLGTGLIGLAGVGRKRIFNK